MPLGVERVCRVLGIIAVTVMQHLQPGETWRMADFCPWLDRPDVASGEQSQAEQIAICRQYAGGA